MKEEREQRFVVRLEVLRDQKDRAALARLRRGLGKRMGTPSMYPYVVPFLPEFPAEQEWYFLVAALFATHPAPCPRGISFGATFHRVWQESGWTESVEKRFTNLLSADADDVGGHLRHAVSLAKNRAVPVDYHRLLDNLKYWSHPNRFVQLAWAKDFWRAEKEDIANAAPKGEDA